MYSTYNNESESTVNISDSLLQLIARHRDALNVVSTVKTFDKVKILLESLSLLALDFERI